MSCISLAIRARSPTHRQGDAGQEWKRDPQPQRALEWGARDPRWCPRCERDKPSAEECERSVKRLGAANGRGRPPYPHEPDRTQRHDPGHRPRGGSAITLTAKRSHPVARRDDAAQLPTVTP
jgi:hypothetical protein